jgi:muramoyltetrapeptide carboxypeptidase
MTKVYVCSPSSAVRRAVEVHRGVRRLQAMGLTVELDASALARDSRFAGSDTQRLEALQRAATSGADVVLTTRGGYGLSRLLPRLPYAAMARSIARGTQWVGFSDFTALQLALLAKRGAVTWQGPALIEDFGQTEAPHALTLACWGDALAGVGEGVGWRVPAAQAANRSWQPLTLWGGNLSMVASLVGTPYLPNVARGALFLEDVGEAPYRVERMLSQLAHAGVLQKQKLILLGAFNRFTPSRQDAGFGLTQVWQWLQANCSATVLTGLPFGHGRPKVMLPFGASVQVRQEGREVLLHWGEVSRA